MNRRTRKGIFLTSFAITMIALFSIAGRHHQFAQRYGCGNYWHHENECHSDHHRANTVPWSDHQSDTLNHQ